MSLFVLIPKSRLCACALNEIKTERLHERLYDNERGYEQEKEVIDKNKKRRTYRKEYMKMKRADVKYKTRERKKLLKADILS